MKALLCLCLLFVPLSLTAQEGSVTYDHTVVYGFANPEARAAQADSARARRGGEGGEGARRASPARGGAAGRRGGGDAVGGGFRMPEGVPTNSLTSVVLRFNGAESVMAQAEEEEAEDEDAPALSPREARIAGFADRIRMMSPVRTDQETLLGAYANNTEGTLIQELEFMGRTFRIKGQRPEYAWRLVAEQSEFMGYMVQKAETEHEGRSIEAWFTPQVPVSAGPGQFGGLPGLILVLSVDRGEELYTATAIELGDLGDGAITPPEDGEEITREDYEELVEEKLEELRNSRPRRRRIG